MSSAWDTCEGFLGTVGLSWGLKEGLAGRGGARASGQKRLCEEGLGRGRVCVVPREGRLGQERWRWSEG